MLGGTAETFDEWLPNNSQKSCLETGLIFSEGLVLHAVKNGYLTKWSEKCWSLVKGWFTYC